MGIRRCLNGHAELIYIPVPPVTLPSATVLLRVGIRWRLPFVSLRGDNRRREGKGHRSGQQPAYANPSWRQ